MTARVPPNAADAEAMVLSALLLDRTLGTFDAVESILEPRHFYGTSHQRTFQAIQSLANEGQPVGAATVANWLHERGWLGGVGGSAYLAQLTDSVPAVAESAATLARTIRDKARLREVIGVCQRTQAEAYAEPTDVDAFAEKVEADLSAALADRERESRQAGAEQLARELLATVSERRSGKVVDGLSWGWPKVDTTIGPQERGEVAVVSGPTGVGKTGFCAQVARHTMANGGGVAFASLEMNRGQLEMRFVAQELVLDSKALASGKLLRQREFDDLIVQAPRYGAWPLEVDDTANMTTTALRRFCRRAHARFQAREPAARLTLLVVDHVGFVGHDDLAPEDRKTKNDAVGAVMRGLKKLAKDFDIPVLAVSHLNRSREYRSDKRPKLTDLRDSGNVEQDAHRVFFLNPKPPKDGEESARKLVELDCAKNRGGPPGRIWLVFTDRCTSFAELTSADSFDGYDDPPDDYGIPTALGPDIDAAHPGGWHD